MKDFVLGIDPGRGGALALYNPATGAVLLHDMPLTKAGSVDYYELGALVQLNADIIRFAVVEHVTSRPRQAGVFNFGMSTGIVYGVLGVCGIKVHVVSPAAWKAGVGLFKAETYGAAKDASRERAAAMFPSASHKFTRKKDDGRAEAALIAVYGTVQHWDEPCA